MILETLQKIAKTLNEITGQNHSTVNRQSLSRSSLDDSELSHRLTAIERDIKELPKRFLRRQ